MKTCVYCGTNKSDQFWFLGGYFGFYGTWCSKCYDLISHDAYGKPINPTGLAQAQHKMLRNDSEPQ